MVNSRVDYVLVKIAQDLSEPLSQFIEAVDGKHASAWSSMCDVN